MFLFYLCQAVLIFFSCLSSFWWFFCPLLREHFIIVIKNKNIKLHAQIIIFSKKTMVKISKIYNWRTYHETFLNFVSRFCSWMFRKWSAKLFWLWITVKTITASGFHDNSHFPDLPRPDVSVLLNRNSILTDKTK